MGLIGGVISGIIASKIIEKLRIPPNIFICPQIAKEADGRYRIKIINESQEDAFDISFYIRLIDPKTDIRFVIMGSTIPILKGTLHAEKKEVESISGIYPQLINSQKINMLVPDAYIRKQYEAQKLSVLDFCEVINGKYIPKIDVVITAKNSQSGRSMTFTKHLTEIVEGQWNVGEKTIKQLNKSRPTL